MLKKEIITKIKDNQALKIELMQQTGKSQYTIDKYLRENNNVLTEFKNLELIKKHLEISDTNQLLDNETTGV